MSAELLGRTLSKRYRFEALIGVGTFADVYRVRDLRRQTVLAAKVLRTDSARDSTFLSRFQRESIVLAHLQHPNIVRYYETVEAQGYIFIVTEYIPGQTFEKVLEAEAAPLKPYGSLTYVTPLASALHFAHSEGIVHRDLKPANILIHENGALYITDFGIARILNQVSDLTLGMTLGTPFYMAPEQITGEAITAAVDIYAMGVLLYQMYTGQLPFQGISDESVGDTPAARVTYEQVHLQPAPPTHVYPDLNPAVEEIILRCLQKEPANRYTTMAEMYDALTEAVGAPPISLEAPMLPDVPSGKLPEWSQFIKPVAKKPPRVRIEHPARPVETLLHVDTQPDLTLSSPSPKETLASFVRDKITQQAIPVYQPPTSRKWYTSWVIRFLGVGIALIGVAMCVLVFYLTNYSEEAAVPAIPTENIEGTAISGSRFAFDSRRTGNLDIYVMNVDGTGLVQLTNSPGAERGPSWSPDGSQIAFYGADSEQSNYDIFLVNSDGTHLRNITETPDVDERYPTWSPDGTQVAFHSNADGDYDIYIINVDGSSLRAVTNNDAQNLGPDWSPDGSRLVFHTDLWDSNFELALVDLSSLEIRRVTNSDEISSFATWSPDGTQLAYNIISGTDEIVNIFIISPDGTNRRQLTNSDDRDAFPDWSPDGTRIIYQSGKESVSGIFVIPVNGGSPQALTGRQANFLPEWSP